jgi:hypothetical protein
VTKLLFSVLFLLVLMVGCVGQSGEEQAVSDTVRRYNRLLAEGYSRMAMEPLLEVASKEEFSRVNHHMAALRDARLRLESRLVKLEFTGVTIKNPRTARAITRESWDFVQIETASGKDSLRARNVVHLLSYDLKKEGDVWRVQRVNPLEGHK